MRKDEGVDGDAQRISQMVWMLFMKILPDKENEWKKSRKTYKSPIPEKLKWQNWAADKDGLTGDELITFINDELFPFLIHIHQLKLTYCSLKREFQLKKYGIMKCLILKEPRTLVDLDLSTLSILMILKNGGSTERNYPERKTQKPNKD